MKRATLLYTSVSPSDQTYCNLTTAAVMKTNKLLTINRI